MFAWASWFRHQLQASGEGFIWAYSQLDPAYRLALPPEPRYLGMWPPARHVWHITRYEHYVALPSMKQWLGGRMPGEDGWPDEEVLWEMRQDVSFDALVKAFWDVRQQQIALLDPLADVDWSEPRETVWGSKPLSMVVTKTYQHTFEHGDTLLRMGLWWAEFKEGE